ncbi:MAG TPA: MarC family protein [Aquella sp.]|nr:MarC family protein [Aquella sp.]
MISNHQLLIFGYFAINPVLAAIVYINMSKDFSLSEKIGTILSSIFFVFIIFIACIYFSQDVLKWLGVPSYVVQLGGGLLILIVGVSQMLMSEQMVEVRSFMYKMTAFGQNQTTAPRLNSGMVFDSYVKDRRTSLGFSPLAIPIMVNPVSVMLMLSEGLDANLITEPSISLIVLGICLIQALVLLQATRVNHILNQIGLLTISRVGGLFLTVIALQMLVTGLKAVVPFVIGAA